jgi:tetratricopeptide (TPR) repeat protein
LLALASREAAEYAAPAKTAAARRAAELAARRALEINPRQSDALTALALLAPVFGYWTDAERRIRAVLAIDAGNGFARSALGTLQMSTGQVAKCLSNLNWLVQRDPWSPNHQFRRIYTLWSDGRLAEMDRAADWALQSWPNHPAVWFARFWTLAFTGRVPVAFGMLHDAASRPPLPQQARQLLETSLRAIAGNAPAERREAIALNVAAAVQSPAGAISAIMILSQLGAADEAYQVAQGFLLQRGRLLTKQRHPQPTLPLTDQHQRMAMMLWIPVTNTLRMHPDFKALCEGIGLVDYWRQAGTGPDFRKAWG